MIKKPLLMAVLALVAMLAPQTMLAKSKMKAYLLVYFLDSDHSLHYAVSHDGYSFTALNGNRAVIAGDTIADQRGIRDPHIYRGPDGQFYLVLTDLHIYGKEKGLRQTQWERPDEYGWGNNRGIVLMRSNDLIHWTHHEVRLDQLFPDEYANIGCAWAPETIYDPATKKMMIYFTIRTVGEGLPQGKPEEKKTRLFYAYANSDFTSISRPQQLYTYPDPKIQVLDADICPMPDGRYFMSYVAQENPGGIKMAVSDRINGGYNYLPQQIDAERTGCEAPTVWKRIGEDKWVLMYDIYSVNPHNFGFVETTDFQHFTPLGHFNEGVMKATNFTSPKHGAVIHLTGKEVKRIEKYWGKK